MNAPCMGCGDRTPGCHAVCKRYEEYTDRRRQMLGAMKEESRIRSASITGLLRWKKARDRDRRNGGK